MACMEHYCPDCKAVILDNKVLKECLNPVCKSPRITNWFDEPQESPNGDDYDMEDE